MHATWSGGANRAAVGVASWELVERQLPLLAACLSHYDSDLHLIIDREIAPPFLAGCLSTVRLACATLAIVS
jgi:hypothetical protein